MHAEGHERRLGGARRQQGDIPHGDDAESDLLDLLRQSQRRLGPSGWVRRAVVRPGVDPHGSLGERHVSAVDAHRHPELGQRLLEPRLGFAGRAIDQTGGVLRDQMLEGRAFSQGDRSGPQSSPEIDQRDHEQERRCVEEQAKSLRRRLRGHVTIGEQRARLLERRSGRHGEQRLQGVAH